MIPDLNFPNLHDLCAREEQQSRALYELVESPDLNQFVVARANQQTAVGRIPVNAVHVVLVRILNFGEQIKVHVVLIVLLEHTDRIVSTGGRQTVVRFGPAHTVDRVLVVTGQRTNARPFAVQLKPNSNRLIVAHTGHLTAVRIEIDRPHGGLVIVERLKAGPVITVLFVELDRIIVGAAGQQRFVWVPADMLHILTVIGQNTGTLVLVHTDVLPDPDGLVTTAGGQKFVVRRVGDHLDLVLVALQIHVALPFAFICFVASGALPNADGRIETAADQFLAIV